MISIIIPVLNEAENIQGLLRHLRVNSAGYIQEIILVDGGSTDGTIELLLKESDITLMYSEKGRAKQMNMGARAAKAEILYFLHADSFPPKQFDQIIWDTVTKQHQCQAGCFMIKFDSNHWWLRLMGRLTVINHICCRGGDQSLFVLKDLFWKVGGFNEDFIICEDNEIIKKLYAATKFKVIKKRLITSSRKYQSMGVWKLQWIYLQIYWKKRLGSKPEDLYDHYKQKIAI